MRLSILDNGHRRRAKLFMSSTALISRVDSPDIVKLLLYRPDFFARPLLALTVEAMRGPSYWTVAEREYLAMSIARSHRCAFCLDSHTEMIRLVGQGEVNADDPGSARVELRTVRDFLLATDRDPDGGAEVATVPVDAVPVGAVPVDAVPVGAVREAVRVGLVWQIVNRLANSFGFRLREGQLESGVRSLNRFGYRFPNFLISGGEPDGDGDAVAQLRHSVFEAPARTEAALRVAARDGTAAEPVGAYSALVRDTSYRVTDEDVERLRTAGFTEDQIFEITVAAAVGAALRGYDAAMRVS